MPTTTDICSTGGFRIDSELSQKNSVTTPGDVYAGSEGGTIVHTVLSPPEKGNEQRLADLSGGNVLTGWNSSIAAGRRTRR
jgi:hypothetical protein